MADDTLAWHLLQSTLSDAAGLQASASALATAFGGTLHRVAWSAGSQRTYAYLRLPAGAATAAELARAWAQLHPTATQVQASKLELVFDTAGASAGEVARFHYVVETDPEAGWMPEIARWYDEEHMPGLAAVPGCIRAMRFLNQGHGPLSLACYDLTTDAALGSPPWLKVRGTAWSDRARPHFTNTLRTMFVVPPSL